MNPLRSLHKKLCGYGAGMLSKWSVSLLPLKSPRPERFSHFFSVFASLPFVICVSSSWGIPVQPGIPNGGAMPGIPDANLRKSILPIDLSAAKIVGQGDSHESTNTHLIRLLWFGVLCGRGQ